MAKEETEGYDDEGDVIDETVDDLLSDVPEEEDMDSSVEW
jgi:hypothetical protein